MSAYGSVLVSTPPAGWLYDFDLVTIEGQPLLVGTSDADHRVYSWDPLADHWTEHPLRNAAQEEGVDYTELTALGAAVSGGRLVAGGGGAHQGFAIWDLHSGAVRVREEPGGVGSTTVAEIGGRPMFVVGGADGPGIALWEATATEQGDAVADWRDAVSALAQPSVYDHRIQIEEIESVSYASSAIAAGVLAGSPVVLGGGRDRLLVWDVERQRVLTGLDQPVHALDGPATDFAFVSVGGRAQVLAAGGLGLLLGDLETGEWSGDVLDVPGGEISCLDTGVVDDRVLAVTGAEDGTVGVWDLGEGRMLGQPLTGYDHTVYGVRFSELDNRPVIIGTAHADAVRVWEVPLRG